MRSKKHHALPFHLTLGGLSAAALALVIAGFDIKSDAHTDPAATIAATLPAAQTAPIAADTADAPLAAPMAATQAIKPVALRNPEPEMLGPVIRTHRIESGDALSGVLSKLGASNRDAYLASLAITKHVNARRLKVGQLLTATFNENNPDQLQSITLKLDAEDTVTAHRDADRFKGKLIHVPLKAAQHRASGLITSSLYEGMLDAGVPDAVIVNLIHIFSFDVDFQRDIRSGDKFDLYYETQHDDEGNLAKTGPILYGQLTLRGKDIALYRHKDGDGFTDYYHPDGSSSKKLLMRTPIDGARISSRYGKRKHPVLGYHKMHKGVDFAAPRGTPIKAAGNGTIEYAGRNGSFGIYVRIRHNGTYKTAYAHMKGLGRGIRKGTRVRQGQTIGYVGTTGRSTGPHLHYEVHKNGRQVNPHSIKLPTGKKLDQKEMARFIANRDKVNVALAETQPASMTADAR